jgi:type IV secretion system protein VirB10
MSPRIGLKALICLSAFSAIAAYGQEASQAAGFAPAGEVPATYVVDSGTHIALALISSVSSKSSSAGDRIYLQTAFPIVNGNHIVIPTGSYVAGTVTEVKRPGRVKGRGQLSVRFDSITLPNGVTREFRSRLGSVDARSAEKLDHKEGEVVADSNTGSDVKTVATGAITGGTIGVIAGNAAGHVGEGAGIGAAAGAAVGMAAVLFTRGPDAELTKGSTVEMVLDRPLTFAANEVSFADSPPGHFAEGPGPQPNRNESALPTLRRKY